LSDSYTGFEKHISFLTFHGRVPLCSCAGRNAVKIEDMAAGAVRIVKAGSPPRQNAGSRLTGGKSVWRYAGVVGERMPQHKNPAS
jgi:hypothetical protein